MTLLRMLFSRKCQHPAGALGVEKGATSEQHDEDFDFVTYHLYCNGCMSPVKVTFAKMRGGHDAFMARGRLQG